MKREDLVTQLYLALVASNEIKVADKAATAQIQEHLRQHDAIQAAISNTNIR